MNNFERGLKTRGRLRPVPGFPDYYASPEGDVWSGKGCFGYKKLCTVSDIDGYLLITLCKKGKQFRRRVHRTVLEAFVGLCPAGMEGCHRNGIKTDNAPGNLRWDTHSNNMYDHINKEKIMPGGVKL